MSFNFVTVHLFIYLFCQLLILFFCLFSEWEMPLGTKESTLRQDFLRGQTSSGIQTVRLTKDICYFPHS